MKALRYLEIGKPPVLVDIPQPTAGPGQVVLKVTASGVCHSDQHVMSLPETEYRRRKYPLPLTLGHEGAGVVHEIGEGANTSLQIGDAVAVYGPWGCGHCHNCSMGRENYCTNAASLGLRPPGLGNQGAMAEYMLIDDPRHLVPLGNLDPVKNVSLTDAGLTPYHAIKGSAAKLGAGSYAVVIGTGGLGHLAVQILKAVTAATVIALDINEASLQLAREVGADLALISDTDAAAKIREYTGGIGANAVFDFVGAAPTIPLAIAVAAPEADVVIVGAGGGDVTFGFGSIAYDVAVRIPYWGYRNELIEVLDLARAGKISVETTTYSLEDAATAYRDLAAGSLRGRAVIVP